MTLTLPGFGSPTRFRPAPTPAWSGLPARPIVATRIILERLRRRRGEWVTGLALRLEVGQPHDSTRRVLDRLVRGGSVETTTLPGRFGPSAAYRLP